LTIYEKLDVPYEDVRDLLINFKGYSTVDSYIRIPNHQSYQRDLFSEDRWLQSQGHHGNLILSMNTHQWMLLFLPGATAVADLAVDV